MLAKTQERGLPSATADIFCVYYLHINAYGRRLPGQAGSPVLLKALEKCICCKITNKLFLSLCYLDNKLIHIVFPDNKLIVFCVDLLIFYGTSFFLLLREAVENILKGGGGAQ